MVLRRFPCPSRVIKKKDHYHPMCTNQSLAQMLETMDQWSWSEHLNPRSPHRNDSIYWAVILVMKFNDRNRSECTWHQNDWGKKNKNRLKP